MLRIVQIHLVLLLHSTFQIDTVDSNVQIPRLRIALSYSQQNYYFLIQHVEGQLLRCGIAGLEQFFPLPVEMSDHLRWVILVQHNKGVRQHGIHFDIRHKGNEGGRLVQELFPLLYFPRLMVY